MNVVSVFTVRALVVASLLAVPASTAASVYVTMISHFDRPWAMSADDLDAFERLTARHPKMRWTHLYNPVAYTQETPLREQMETFVRRTRDNNDAEIGVHLHMYKSLLDASGVEFRVRPSVNAKSLSESFDNSGYAVPITRYSREEIRKLLKFSRKTFLERNLGSPKTFCAGFYATSVDLQKEIASDGYTTSAAAFPPGTEFGAKYAPVWHQLSGWKDEVTHKTRPYLVSQKSILPSGTAPYIKSKDGRELLEIPQTCKIDWMVTAEEMQVILKQHVAIAERGEVTAVCFAIHETSGAEHFDKYDQVLQYVDSLMENRKVPVKYVTASELRRVFLQQVYSAQK